VTNFFCVCRYLQFFQNANVKVFSEDAGGELSPALFSFMEEEDESSRQFNHNSTQFTPNSPPIQLNLTLINPTRMGRVAIFDATNHKRDGRKRMWERGHANRWKVMFLETQLRDEG